MLLEVREVSILKNKWLIIAIITLCWALLASLMAGYYWLQYDDFANRVGGVPIQVNIGIDYGNANGTLHGMRTWYNDTSGLIGMTLFKVTRSIANVTHDTSAGYGVYVNSINNVTASGFYGWVWWKWDGQNWAFVGISSDAYALADGETFMWYYESGDIWPPTPPI